jgi:hypothetical protein
MLHEKQNNELIKNDIPQEFNKEGMMELTNARANEIIKKITQVLNKEKIVPVINRGFGSESQDTLLFFTGEDVLIRFKVPATDKHGNDGRVWMTQEEYASLKNKTKQKN